MMNYEWDIYEAWFNQVEGLGKHKMRRIADLGICFKELYYMPENDLEECLNIAYSGRSSEGHEFKEIRNLKQDLINIKSSRNTIDAEGFYNELRNKNINYVNQEDKEYPKALLTIPDSPYAFYRKGKPFEVPQNHTRVAIIGARNCSEYGKYVANELGRACAGLGIEVVSGLARGVDGISQNAARGMGGEVTAVLGCGVDICYPPSNQKIYDSILENGRIISEYTPGIKPQPQFFPPRNRIISGLCEAVVVVEAKKKSGTLITVDMALEQGRDVYMIPGRVTDAMSYGCNRLIKQGAEIVVDIMDSLNEILEKSIHNIYYVDKDKCDIDTNTINDINEKLDGQITLDDIENSKHNNNYVNSMEEVIYSVLDFDYLSVQEIYDRVCQKYDQEFDLQKLQEKLLTMELFGKLTCQAGRFARKGDI